MALDRGGLVSVVIPCYILDEELLDFTKDCVASWREHCPDAELILVDNGSPLDDYLRGAADLYIRNRENLGFAPAVNQGLKLARGEWLCQCNNDIRLLDDWPSLAISTWEENTGAVAPHRRPGRDLGRDTPWQVMWGALWLIHRSVMDKVGYLDENYKLGMREDRDYWLRILGAGYDLVSVGHAWHKGNATWRKLPKAERRQAHANNKAYFGNKWQQT